MQMTYENTMAVDRGMFQWIHSIPYCHHRFDIECSDLSHIKRNFHIRYIRLNSYI